MGIIGGVPVKACDSSGGSGDRNVSDSYWASTEKAMGVEGMLKPDNAIVFDIPMTVKVSLDGIPLNLASDRTHEFDFMKAGNKSLLVGEIGVTEMQVKNVCKMALRSGLQVTAIHNHLLRTSPHIIWIHICGYGDPADMAVKIRSITDYVNGKPPAANVKSSPVIDINTTVLDRIIGKNGSAGGGDYSFEIARADNISMNGYVLSPVMDVSTMINFQPLGNGNAEVIGEFVLEENEVDPVMRAFIENDIEVTALHSHMITEQPRIFYMHCWATGNAEDLASAMRQALDKTNSEI
jgi:hypothetical protein